MIKNINFVLVITIALIISGCGSDDGIEEEATIPINSPPNEFSLLTVNNGANDVALKPKLTWSVATDPNDDPVTYDLVLDNNSSPNTIIASNINETEFTFSTSIQFSEVFYWKVIAKDNNGGSTESSIFRFTSVDLFSEINNNASFGRRMAHKTIVFDNKMWVIGGIDYNLNSRNDVWSSTDGIQWTEATSNAPFSNRYSHSTLVFNNKIWVIGGYSDVNENDVWSSSDGVNWTEETSKAPFSPRYAHASVVYENKMWVIGGEVRSGPNSINILDDVWNSSDGVNWTQVNTVSFPARARHTSVVFDNKIWLIAGLGQEERKNDVWNSTDGVNWVLVNAEAPFTNRYYHTTVTFNDKLWLIGGFPEDNSNVWSSSDGIDWALANSIYANSIFSRHLHTSVVYNDRLWVIAGRVTTTPDNDIWSMN